MFGPVFRGLSIARVISGMSKGLDVANRIIPIYKETKPMIQNARNAVNLIKEFGNNTANKIVTNTTKNTKEIKEKINTIKSVNLTNHNNPTFFQ